MAVRPGRATIVGGSVAGLLAARVLAGTYRQVTVVDRDDLPTTADQRRGVPQAKHAHGLMPAGSAALDHLFPGLLDEWEGAGVPVIREPGETMFAPGGIVFADGGHYRQVTRTYQPSRPLLEAALRRRVQETAGVEVRPRTECSGVRFDRTGRRVMAARVRGRDDADEQDLDTDLVVDATGRTGRAAVWLAEAGFPAPIESTLGVDLRYASSEVRLRHGVPGGYKAMVLGASAGRPTGANLIQHEDDRWMLTVFGYGRHHPPTTTDAWLAFADEVLPRATAAAVREGELLAPVAGYRYPASRRRHFERLTVLPEGLIAFGDAVCSFNPVYGQGMSVAALQAVALERCLERGGTADLGRRFHRAASRPIEIAYRMAVNSDLALPEVEGERTRAVRLTNAYMGALLDAAGSDATLATTFVRASSLISSPALLVAPTTLARLARHRWRTRRSGATTRPTPPTPDPDADRLTTTTGAEP